MKKLFTFVLIFALLLSGCGKTEEPLIDSEDIISSTSSESENENKTVSEAEISSVPEEEQVSMTFKLGSNGETVELFPGDSIGEWKLENLEIDYDESGFAEFDSIEAEFSGNVELKGHIERNPMAELAYDFIIDRSEYNRMPFLVSKDFKEFRGHFVMNIPEGLENSPKLDWNETLPAKITISGFRINCAFTETFDGADVVKIEPLSEEIPALYKDMLINFGAKVNESGELVVKKGVNFYYDVVGVSDYLLEDSIRFHSWAMSRSDLITKIEVSLPGFSDKVYAYPAEIFESEVFKYFGRTAESLRVPGFYYEEQNCYFLDGHGGIGEIPFIVVNNIEENDDMVTFHITLDYEFDNDRDMALTVKLLPDGGYNYVSYLRE